ncbi:amidohydrolase [Streptomyces sp. NPDC007206]|uniref:amidohydrolase n=1 Tax=Streptomyces sp. NPDC007206 TaxID=3154317 RepID=UPI0033EF2A31
MATTSDTAPADLILLNGLVWPGGEHQDGPEPTALAVRDGRVVAYGSDVEIRELAGPRSTVGDLHGRRVVPGLIDGHMHAVRGGPTWTSELRWTGETDLRTALATLRAAADAARPGEWIRVVGGWHPCQFTESREPTRAELDALVPHHPVYVQALYEVAVLNSAALRSAGIDATTPDPAGGHLERDPVTGELTGRVFGMGAFNRILDSIPPVTPEREQRSTAAMFADLHALGLTGIVDAGGFGMPPQRYEPLFALWRDGGLSMRMRLFLSAADPGQEYQELQEWMRHTPPRFGDPMLRFAGIGEVVHHGCHDFEGLEDFTISDDAAKELLRISYRAAEQGWPMNIHAVLDESIDPILTCWETVHERIPLHGLRFSLSHADRISPRNLRRLAAMGAGVVLDDHQVFKAGFSEAAWGEGSMSETPPIADMIAAGIPLAAGTDATRSSSHNPWLSLWWLINGHSVDGVTRRAARHRMSRERALECYTAGSAWLSFEEAGRGRLAPGALADFAVLSEDYFTVPVDRIPWIRSELTVVGGEMVHTTGTVALP